MLALFSPQTFTQSPQIPIDDYKVPCNLGHYFTEFKFNQSKTSRTTLKDTKDQ